MPDPLFRLQVSYSQVSSLCGYKLKLDRIVWDHERNGHPERNPLCRLCLEVPPAPKSIKPIYGTAVHAGIEHQLTTGQGEEAALLHAKRVLSDEIAEWTGEGKPSVLWDHEPRRRRDGELYKGDEKVMPDAASAVRNLNLAVPSWIRRFADKIEVDGQPERSVLYPLEGAYEGCRIKMVLDVPTTEGGLVDIKASGSDTWNRDDKLDGKLVQGHLYNLGYKHEWGHPPTSMVFHVLETGSDRIQIIEVPYDEGAIQRTLEHSVYPLIRAIEANALVPATNGWWHSEQACDHWFSCPLGSSARGASRRISLELVA